MSESEMSGSILLFAGGKNTGAADGAGDPVNTEARLVGRVCAGDETAFAELYKIYAPMVHGIILARVPYKEVDDIAQDVFFAAFKNMAALRDRDAVGPWLGTIARNQVVAFYRRTRPVEELTDNFACSNHARTEAGEVMEAIHSLPVAYAETLVLRLVEGMTGPEIAERTGLTPESVRVNLHRGMKLLRQKLGVTE